MEKQIVIKGNKDINDIFCEIFFAEDNIIKESYNEGYKKGVEEDNIDGYHLGYHRGAEVGAELGYYSYLIDYYLKNSGNNPDTSKKVTDILKTLQDLIDKFPGENNEEFDIIHMLEDIRVKFKKFSALAKINMPFSDGDKYSF